MKNIKYIITAVLLTVQMHAAELPFLREGARPAGMAGAFTAVADDHNALTVNPAGMAAGRNNIISLEGLIQAYDFDGGGFSAGYLNAGLSGSLILEDFGFSLAYIKAGDRYDSSRSQDGYRMSGAFAYDTGNGIYIGAGANVIIQTGLDGGAGFDAGVIYKPNDNISFGIALKNFIASGSFMLLDNEGNVRFTNYPFFINLGFAVKPFKNTVIAFDIKNLFELEYKYTDVTLISEAVYPNDGYSYGRSYHLGAEHYFNDVIGVRAGVRGFESEEYIPYSPDEATEHRINYAVSAGAGIKAGRFIIDFTVENDFRKVNNTVNPFRFSAGVSGTFGHEIFIVEKGGNDGPE